MAISGLTALTFILLAAAICAVWLPPVRISRRMALPPWSGCFVAAACCGLAAGVLNPWSAAALAIFCGIACLAATARQPSVSRILLTAAAAIVALALALHRLPGFNNPLLISALTLSAGAAPFSQYASFDKGAAGLVLLALLCRRADSAAAWRDLLKKTWPAVLATTIAVLGAATWVGYVKADVKLSQTTALFLATNLFFTVVAEEAFFRGVLQDRLAASLARFRHGPMAALVCSALLFGAAHAAGGGVYVMLATIAGFGYAYAYYATQRIEAPIIAHIAVNAVHFIGFTYPYLR
ncbi:CPBP family intramembrane glutamic endopeptidase [Collimonas humicola]|uniref:CPBP family intramembrane glutamic endopeptidase n=1 Tax=Collimonas humicola TaxID=2825886 RepID=UPI001B8BFF94|nr:CPBP family intramembrane glutamic endopeptidase [Collimonas humicola]